MSMAADEKRYQEEQERNEYVMKVLVEKLLEKATMQDLLDLKMDHNIDLEQLQRELNSY